MCKLLIVENDPVISSSLLRYLTKCNYDVQIATQFNTMLDILTQFKPELICLDINLPSFHSHPWCETIHKFSEAQILFISSITDSMDMLTVTNMGGNDFITTPLDLEATLAKIQVLLNKSYHTQQSNILQHREVTLNLNDATLIYRGQKLHLSKNDFKILKILLSHTGEVVNRDYIILSLCEASEPIDDNTLTVNMTRLRKKLATIGLNRWIITKKGVGYIIL